MAQQKFLKVGEIIFSENMSSKITLPLLNSKPGARLVRDISHLFLDFATQC